MFGGTVSHVRLAPVVQQNVVSCGTVIDAPNTDLRLEPGMTATVTVEIALRLSPPTALVISDSSYTAVSERPPG